MFENLKQRLAESKVALFLEAAAAHGQTDVVDAITKAKASGISIVAIALALAPFVLKLFQGQPIDWKDVLSAVLGLFTSKS